MRSWRRASSPRYSSAGGHEDQVEWSRIIEVCLRHRLRTLRAFHRADVLRNEDRFEMLLGGPDAERFEGAEDIEKLEAREEKDTERALAAAF